MPDRVACFIDAVVVGGVVVPAADSTLGAEQQPLRLRARLVDTRTQLHRAELHVEIAA